MDMNLDMNLERIGFWGLLAIYIVRDGLIPIFNRYIPSRIKLTEREQDRQDKRQEFEHEMEMRHVVALEGIQEVIVLMNDRIGRIEDVLSRPKKSTK